MLPHRWRWWRFRGCVCCGICGILVWRRNELRYWRCRRVLMWTRSSHPRACLGMRFGCHDMRLGCRGIWDGLRCHHVPRLRVGQVARIHQRLKVRRQRLLRAIMIIAMTMALRLVGHERFLEGKNEERLPTQPTNDKRVIILSTTDLVFCSCSVCYKREMHAVSVWVRAWGTCVYS